MKKIIAVFSAMAVFLASLAGCGMKSDMKDTSVADSRLDVSKIQAGDTGFSILIPENWEIRNDSSKTMDLMVSNPNRTAFVGVIIEKKSETTEESTAEASNETEVSVSGEEPTDELDPDTRLYAASVKKHLAENSGISEISAELVTVKTGAGNAQSFDCSLNIDGVDFYYDIAAGYSGGFYYQIIGWTYAENQETSKPLFDRIIRSFE